MANKILTAIDKVIDITEPPLCAIIWKRVEDFYYVNLYGIG